jgi:hypothetical protein
MKDRKKKFDEARARGRDLAHAIKPMPPGFARAYHAGTDWEAWLRGTKLRLDRFNVAMLRGLARYFGSEVDGGLARCAFAELRRRKELEA